MDFPVRRVTWVISLAFIFRTLYDLCFKIVSFSCHAKSSWEKQISRRAGYPYWATRLQQPLQSRLPISISGRGGQWSQTWKNEEKMSSLGNAANLHLIRRTLMYLIQHKPDDVTSSLFFRAFVCVYCIHERYCPLPHAATPPSISTNTHTHNTLRNMVNMFHVPISTQIPWRNMLAAFLQCVCMRLLYPWSLFPLPAPLHPTPLSQPIYETMVHLEDGKRSANTNRKSNSVSKSDLECSFWNRQKHIQVTCKNLAFSLWLA